ncbi:family 78 glycoside hydrolase catalytic domain [uncultured Alistipes sp.]|uniref:family 78 glycoside hydrolase catalytic domain n=1 Tax=uncultured Alistipes sp. TaxID=538949 RepID=UPI0025F7A05C|nr:family 78 glycoside hydrolase catalytic domain [uncultured Alistipes sp.]
MKRIFLYALLLLGPHSGTGMPAANPADNSPNTRSGNPSLVRLTCEGLTAPLAIDTATPRFGWQLRSERQGDAQRSYRIEVASDSLRLLSGNADLWDSGEVRSDNSVGIPYEGLPLTDGMQYWWRVTLRTVKGGRKVVSPAARFGIGLTGPASVAGEFIGLSGSGATAVLLRRKFDIRTPAEDALLHVNSLGYHEVWVNGRKVGDACLAPAVSQLDKRSLWVAYDVRPYLCEGDNELVIWLGQGWYKRGTFGRWQPGEPYSEPLVRAQLDIGSANGRQTVCRTDTAWRAALSGYRDTGSWNALDFGGEEIDARRNPRSMSPADLDALEWQPVVTAEKPGHRATPQMVEPDCIQERLTACGLHEAAPGVWRLDFGRVVTGWLEADFAGLPAGARVEIEYSDETDAGGNLADQRQHDTYIARGDGRERFTNKFNHHAFRYAEVCGLVQTPRREDFRALAIHTDYRTEATFASSDADLNAIHDMIARTLRCLAYNGYMVDCPHLERAGYGGDGNSSTEILQTLYGTAPLYRNWVQAWDDAMRPGGSLPHVAPNAGAGGGGPYWCGFLVMAPWQTWLNYGDRTLIDRHYPAMREWMGYVERYMKDGLLARWPDTPYRDWFLGDWLAPHGVDAGNEASVSLVNNCFVSDCYARMAQMARLTGRDDEATTFEARRDTLNRTIHARFYDPATQTYATGSQLDMVYPMLVGATPDSLRDGVRQQLFRLTHEVMNDHIGGGLVGVPVITRWAIGSHAPDFIYRMLKQRGYPGYLYMLDRGATATWEYWSGERSRVHNCYNGIGTWFYQALGGLRTDDRHPGYRHVFIDPQIPEGVEWCRIAKETPYGRIDLGWELAGDELRIDVALPPGVTATAITPANACSGRLDGRKTAPEQQTATIGSGRHRLVFGLRPRNETK